MNIIFRNLFRLLFNFVHIQNPLPYRYSITLFNIYFISRCKPFNLWVFTLFRITFCLMKLINNSYILYYFIMIYLVPIMLTEHIVLYTILYYYLIYLMIFIRIEVCPLPQFHYITSEQISHSEHCLICSKFIFIILA